MCLVRENVYWEWVGLIISASWPGGKIRIATDSCSFFHSQELATEYLLTERPLVLLSLPDSPWDLVSKGLSLHLSILGHSPEWVVCLWLRLRLGAVVPQLASGRLEGISSNSHLHWLLQGRLLPRGAIARFLSSSRQFLINVIIDVSEFRYGPEF